jgi:hypothetical protein
MFIGADITTGMTRATLITIHPRFAGTVTTTIMFRDTTTFIPKDIGTTTVARTTVATGVTNAG